MCEFVSEGMGLQEHRGSVWTPALHEWAPMVCHAGKGRAAMNEQSFTVVLGHQQC